jgi:hypothetical protein
VLLQEIRGLKRSLASFSAKQQQQDEQIKEILRDRSSEDLRKRTDDTSDLDSIEGSERDHEDFGREDDVILGLDSDDNISLADKCPRRTGAQKRKIETSAVVVQKRPKRTEPKSDGRNAEEPEESHLQASSFAELKSFIAKESDLMVEEMGKVDEDDRLLSEKVLDKSDTKDTHKILLPASSLIRKAYAKANSVIRGVPVEDMLRPKGLKKWEFSSLPAATGKAAWDKTLQKPSALKPEWYDTVDMPKASDETPLKEFMIPAHVKDRFADWRKVKLEAQMSLQATGYVEQIIGVLTKVFNETSASEEEMKMASELIVSGVGALRHVADAQARLVANATVKCRKELLFTCPKEVREQVMRMPVDCDSLTPFLKEVKEEVVKSKNSDLILSAAERFSGDNKQYNPRFNRKGDRNQSKQGQKYQNPHSKPNSSFPKNQSGEKKSYQSNKRGSDRQQNFSNFRNDKKFSTTSKSVGRGQKFPNSYSQ